MAKVKIGMPYKAPSLTVERFGRLDYVVPYTIDGVGPFEVRLPDEEFTPEKGEAAVRTEAKRQTALAGRELSV